MAEKRGAALGRERSCKLIGSEYKNAKVKNREIQRRKYKNTKTGNQINFENWLEKRGAALGRERSCKLIGPGQEGWVEH